MCVSRLGQRNEVGRVGVRRTWGAKMSPSLLLKLSHTIRMELLSRGAYLYTVKGQQLKKFWCWLHRSKNLQGWWASRKGDEWPLSQEEQFGDRQQVRAVRKKVALSLLPVLFVRWKLPRHYKKKEKCHSCRVSGQTLSWTSQMLIGEDVKQCLVFPRIGRLHGIWN